MAYIEISFIRCANHRRHYFQFDDDTGDIIFDHADLEPLEEECDPNGEVFYEGTNYRAIVDGADAYTEAIPAIPCTIIIDSVVSSPALDGASNGTITAAAHCDGTTQYRVVSAGGVVLYDWQISGNFINVPAGTWYLYARDSEVADCFAYQIIVVDAGSSLAANISGTNVTYIGGNDGTLQIQITGGAVVGGVGSFTLQPDWEGPSVMAFGTLPLFALYRINLTPDTYTVLITDNNSGLTLTLSIVITGPPPVIPPDPPPGTTGDFLFVPMLNSIQFVKEETVNNCSINQTFDNVLFCKQRFEGFWPSHYWQKVAKCDVLTLQIQSNYLDTAHVIKLKDYKTGADVKTYSAITKEQNIGQVESFDISLTADDDSLRSRVFFNVGSIPIPSAIGDSFEVFDNPDGMNGTYLIVAIQNDELLGTQFLVINKEYTPLTPSTNAQAKFLVNLVEFNVLEILINNLETVANGVYYFEISAESDEAEIVWTSEPIDLQPTHPKTNLIEYRNFDNAYDMTFTTGIVCRVRVESRLFQRLPGGSRTTTRNSDESLHKLQAKKRRAAKFEFFRLPPYMLEKLSVIFDCDYFAVNGVEYQTEEEIAEPRYTNLFALANSDVRIEQVGWFRNNNSDDLGNVDAEEGFIIVNGGFLKR